MTDQNKKIQLQSDTPIKVYQDPAPLPAYSKENQDIKLRQFECITLKDNKDNNNKGNISIINQDDQQLGKSNNKIIVINPNQQEKENINENEANKVVVDNYFGKQVDFVPGFLSHSSRYFIILFTSQVLVFFIVSLAVGLSTTSPYSKDVVNQGGKCYVYVEGGIYSGLGSISGSTVKEVSCNKINNFLGAIPCVFIVAASIIPGSILFIVYNQKLTNENMSLYGILIFAFTSFGGLMGSIFLSCISRTMAIGVILTIVIELIFILSIIIFNIIFRGLCRQIFIISRSIAGGVVFLITIILISVKKCGWGIIFWVLIVGAINSLTIIYALIRIRNWDSGRYFSNYGFIMMLISYPYCCISGIVVIFCLMIIAFGGVCCGCCCGVGIFFKKEEKVEEGGVKKEENSASVGGFCCTTIGFGCIITRICTTPIGIYKTLLVKN